eukprot:737387_1
MLNTLLSILSITLSVTNAQVVQGISGYYVGSAGEDYLAFISVLSNNEIRVDLSSAGRQEASGFYNPNTETGSVTFPDDSHGTYSFKFDSENGIIDWDESLAGIWGKVDIIGRYFGQGNSRIAIIKRTYGNSISIDMSSTHRPNAYGTYNDPVYPYKYGIATVTFVDDKTYEGYFYGDENRIYWDAPRGQTNNKWQ